MNIIWFIFAYCFRQLPEPKGKACQVEGGAPHQCQGPTISQVQGVQVGGGPPNQYQGPTISQVQGGQIVIHTRTQENQCYV